MSTLQKSERIFQLMGEEAVRKRAKEYAALVIPTEPTTWNSSRG